MLGCLQMKSPVMTSTGVEQISLLLSPALLLSTCSHLSFSFTQYVSKATNTVRCALKEPAKSKALQNEVFSFKESVWTAGVQGEKIPKKGVDLDY
jgi:hypothetical protein